MWKYETFTWLKAFLFCVLESFIWIRCLFCLHSCFADGTETVFDKDFVYNKWYIPSCVPCNYYFVRVVCGASIILLTLLCWDLVVISDKKNGQVLCVLLTAPSFDLTNQLTKQYIESLWCTKPFCLLSSCFSSNFLILVWFFGDWFYIRFETIYEYDSLIVETLNIFTGLLRRDSIWQKIPRDWILLMYCCKDLFYRLIVNENV